MRLFATSNQHRSTVIKCIFCLAVFVSTRELQAQYLSNGERASIASRNNSFENDLQQWCSTAQLTARLLTRSWPLDPSDRYEPYFGSKLLHLQGEGSLGQVVVLSPTISKQVLNGFACKQAAQPGQASGFAALAVTYYDGSWCELDRIVIPIEEKDPSKNRGPGDGLNFYSWGTAVPDGAVTAYLYRGFSRQLRIV